MNRLLSCPSMAVAATYLHHLKTLASYLEEDAFDEDLFGHIALGMFDLEGFDASESRSVAAQLAVVDVAEPELGEARQGAHGYHWLRRFAHVAWRHRCGRSAVPRVGIG